MIFSIYALLIEKNVLTYNGETIFLSHLEAFKKNRAIYQQSFKEVDKEPKDFFLKRLIEKHYLRQFNLNFTDRLYEEQLEYRAASLKMSRNHFLQAIQGSGLEEQAFKDLLAWQFYHQHFVKSFENKVDIDKETTLKEETFYEFSRFEVDQQEASSVQFKQSVEKLITQGDLVSFKSFQAQSTPQSIPQSSLDEMIKNELKNLKINEFSKVLTENNKWVLVYLKSRKKKKLNSKEIKDVLLFEKTYNLANSYLSQEFELFKLNENN